MDDTAARLLALERRLAAADPADAGLADLLAVDFVEFGASGRTADRAATLAALATGGPRRIAIDQATVVPLGPDAALVTYRSTSRLADEGWPRVANRSSIWVRRDGRWQVRFHQGTLLPGGGR